MDAARGTRKRQSLTNETGRACRCAHAQPPMVLYTDVFDLVRSSSWYHYAQGLVASSPIETSVLSYGGTVLVERRLTTVTQHAAAHWGIQSLILRLLLFITVAASVVRSPCTPVTYLSQPYSPLPRSRTPTPKNCCRGDMVRA